MVAYVLRHNEHFLIDAKDPAWPHYQPFKRWLLPHGLAGAYAPLLGLCSSLIACTSVLQSSIASPLGTYIQYFDERMGESRTFTAAAAVDAILLIITTGIAFAFILKGKVQQHVSG